MALHPACRIALPANDELVLAAVDAFHPTAADLRSDALLVFFPNARLRAQARDALARELPELHVTDCEVDDEDWARRSQAGLMPVRVGALYIVPSAEIDSRLGGGRSADIVSNGRRDLTIVIRPSMGFGTGHHASTRLCLAALQTLDLAGAFVLDVGTGSGILALAARRLGARSCLGIDSDDDAVASARENLTLNPGIRDVRFDVGDLTAAPLPKAQVVTANLTGALLARVAPTIADALAPGGHLIVSGLLEHEREAVQAAFAGLTVVWDAREDEWVGLCLRAPTAGRR